MCEVDDDFHQYITKQTNLSGLQLQTALLNKWFDLAEMILPKIHKCFIEWTLTELLHTSIQQERQDCETWLLAHGAKPNKDTPFLYINCNRLDKVLFHDTPIWILNTYLYYTIDKRQATSCLRILEHFVLHTRCDSPSKHDYAHNYFLTHDDCLALFRWTNQSIIHKFILENNLCEALYRINKKQNGYRDEHIRNLNNYIYFTDLFFPLIKVKQYKIFDTNVLPLTQNVSTFLAVCEYDLHLEINAALLVEEGYTECLTYLLEHHGIRLSLQAIDHTINIKNASVRVFTYDHGIDINIVNQIRTDVMEKTLLFLEQHTDIQFDYVEMVNCYLHRLEYSSSCLSYLLSKIPTERRHPEYINKDYTSRIVQHPLALDIIRIYFGQMTSEMFQCFFEIDDIQGLLSVVNMCKVNKLCITFDPNNLQYLKSKDMAMTLYDHVLIRATGGPPFIPSQLFFSHPSIFLFFVEKGYSYDLMQISKEIMINHPNKVLCTLERTLFRFVDVTLVPFVQEYDNMRNTVRQALDGLMTEQVFDHVLMKYM